MDVIRHQAIAVYAKPMPLPFLLKQPKIGGAVLVYEKHVLAVVAALSDVVRTVRDHDSTKPWHRAILPIRVIRVNPKIGDCPLFSYHVRDRQTETRRQASCRGHFGGSIRRPGALIAAPWTPACLSPFRGLEIPKLGP